MPSQSKVTSLTVRNISSGSKSSNHLSFRGYRRERISGTSTYILHDERTPLELRQSFMRFMLKVPGFHKVSIHQVAGACTMTDAQATQQIAWAVGQGLMYAFPFRLDAENAFREEAFQRLGHKFKHFKMPLEQTLCDPCDPKILTSFLQNRKWFIEALNKIEKGETFSIQNLRSSSSILPIERLLLHVAWAIGRGEMEQMRPAAGQTRKDALQDKVFTKLTDSHSFQTPALETVGEPCDEKTILFQVDEKSAKEGM